jgi:starvation-inducible DNA-binding protein
MATALNVIPTEDTVKTGISHIDQIAEGLGNVLSDTYRLVFKTHACHWNAEGPSFFSIHKLTEGQYEALFAATDVIAERIRALGKLTPMKLSDIVERSKVKDFGDNLSAAKMIDSLAADHEAAAKRLHELIDLADKSGDVVTADMLTDRSAFHETSAWMLRATSKG